MDDVADAGLMGRFLQADDRPSYSDLKPERLLVERYVRPEEARARGEVRSVDDAPSPDEILHEGAPFARRGFAHLKGGR